MVRDKGQCIKTGNVDSRRVPANSFQTFDQICFVKASIKLPLARLRLPTNHSTCDDPAPVGPVEEEGRKAEIEN